MNSSNINWPYVSGASMGHEVEYPRLFTDQNSLPKTIPYHESSFIYNRPDGIRYPFYFLRRHSISSVADINGNIIQEGDLTTWTKVYIALETKYFNKQLSGDWIPFYSDPKIGIKSYAPAKPLPKNITYGFPEAPKVISTTGMKINIIETE